MRVALVYLLVAMTCVMVKEANSTPGFFSDLMEHCPFLGYFFERERDCCCETNRSCCPTTTTSTTTTTTTTTAAPMEGKRRRRWVTPNYYNLSSDIKYNATQENKCT
ncbi:hypothetical protein CAJAP_06289 [Camponotus japonicus]